MAFQGVNAPITYGRDVEAAYEFVTALRDTKALLAGRSEPEARSAKARLLNMLAEHQTGEGVQFAAATWVVTAIRT